jgi:hypothetical protein
MGCSEEAGWLPAGWLDATPSIPVALIPFPDPVN